MFGKMLDMNIGGFARPGRHAKIMLGVAAGLAFLGGGKAMAQDADAGSTTDLFTTVQDFTGWSNGGGSPVTSFGPVTAATYDADGSATNGLASGGGVGTPGSMQINTGSNAVGYTYTVFSANLLYNAAAMAAIDPVGARAARSPSQAPCTLPTRRPHGSVPMFITRSDSILPIRATATMAHFLEAPLFPTGPSTALRRTPRPSPTHSLLAAVVASRSRPFLTPEPTGPASAAQATS